MPSDMEHSQHLETRSARNLGSAQAWCLRGFQVTYLYLSFLWRRCHLRLGLGLLFLLLRRFTVKHWHFYSVGTFLLLIWPWQWLQLSVPSFFPWSHPTTEMNITLDKGHITPLPVHPLNFPPTYNFKWHSTYRFSALPSGILPLSLPHHFVLGVFNGGCRCWQILPILHLMQEFHFFDKLQWLILLSFLKRKMLDPIRHAGM